MRSPCTVLFCKVGEQSVSLSRKLKIATVIIAWFPRARHCCRWIGGTLQWMRKERSLLPWRSHSRGRDRRQMISLSLVSPLPVTLGSLRPFPSGHSSEREWHGWGGGTEGAQWEPQGDRKLLTEKETFEQRPEQREGTRTGETWRRWPSSRATRMLRAVTQGNRGSDCQTTSDQLQIMLFPWQKAASLPGVKEIRRMLWHS